MISGMGVLFASATLIRPEGMGFWSPGVYTGVAGGIPTDRTNIVDVTQSPYNADNTGGSDASVAINAAIAAVPVNTVVYLPPGTYLLSGSINALPASGSSKTVRGAGTNTILLPQTTAQAFNVGSSSDFSFQPTWITNGNARGSTNVTIAALPDTPNPLAFHLLHIFIPDNTNCFSTYRAANNRHQVCLITAASGRNLTIWPPLYDNYETNLLVMFSQSQVNGFGVENLVVDMSNSTATFPVEFEQTYGCWLKNVQVKNAFNYCVYLFESVNFEMRGSTVGPLPSPGPNHSGLLMNYCSASLIEDNFFTNTVPLMEINFGSSGNVFGYNFLAKGIINLNHAPENSFNLFEGNIGVNFESDGYFGGSMYDTFYRNWFHGNNDGVRDFVGTLKRFTRYTTFVGNLFGCTNFGSGDDIGYGGPNIGNGNSHGNQTNNTWWDYDQVAKNTKFWNATYTHGGGSPPTNGLLFMDQSTFNDFTNVAENGHNHTGDDNKFGISWANFINVGVLSNQYVGVSNGNPALSPTDGAVTLVPSPAGFQELDWAVTNTLWQKGNYNFRDLAIPAAQALGSDTLSNSLYLPGKPSWWGAMPWPPFDPTGSPSPAIDSIPAGARFLGETVSAPVPLFNSIHATTLRVVR